MSKPAIEPGRVVVSKQGRDAGGIFAIMKVLDADYVLIADGDLRKAQKPKRKKVKHLVTKPFLIAVSPDMGDSDIRKALNATKIDIDLTKSKEGCALVKG